jgi:single-strand DNA-binding protein
MLNHIVIMGRLTRDPEVRATGSGITVCNFTVAVDRDFTGKDGGEKETDFIDCVAWRKTAEFVTKYFTKGSMIVVSGRLQVRSWTDNDGNKRRNAEIVADNVYFGESKRSAGENSTANNASYAPNSAPSADPFADTKEKLRSYGVTVDAADYSLLDGDDAQLPF